MDYLPPPPSHESAYVQVQLKEKFIIEVDEAAYDKAKMRAVIKMDRAFQKSHKIESYKGEWITLAYQNTKPKLESCPVVDIPVEDIKRTINFVDNEVTLTISNIPESLARNIEQNLCLSIDTYTVKKVGNPNFGEEDGKPQYN